MADDFTSSAGEVISGRNISVSGAWSIGASISVWPLLLLALSYILSSVYFANISVFKMMKRGRRRYCAFDFMSTLLWLLVVSLLQLVYRAVPILLFNYLLGELYDKTNLLILPEIASSLGIAEGIWLVYQELCGLDSATNEEGTKIIARHRLYAIDAHRVQQESRMLSIFDNGGGLSFQRRRGTTEGIAADGASSANRRATAPTMRLRSSSLHR